MPHRIRLTGSSAAKSFRTTGFFHLAPATVQKLCNGFSQTFAAFHDSDLRSRSSFTNGSKSLSTVCYSISEHLCDVVRARHARGHCPLRKGIGARAFDCLTVSCSRGCRKTSESVVSRNSRFSRKFLKRIFTVVPSSAVSLACRRPAAQGCWHP